MARADKPKPAVGHFLIERLQRLPYRETATRFPVFAARDATQRAGVLFQQQRRERRQNEPQPNAPWRGKFYPQGLPQKRELSYAAERFNSIELNGSFYSLQRPGSCRRWRDDRVKGSARTVSPKPPRRRSSRDVFVYFDNDVKVHAPFDAMRLAQKIME